MCVAPEQETPGRLSPRSGIWRRWRRRSICEARAQINCRFASVFDPGTRSTLPPIPGHTSGGRSPTVVAYVRLNAYTIEQSLCPLQSPEVASRAS